MALPKLRVIRRPAHDEAQSQGEAPQGAPGGSARRPTEPVPDAPVIWSGPAEDIGPLWDVGSAGHAGPTAGAGTEPAEASGAAAEPDASTDVPFWDLSASEDPADPGDPADGYRWDRVLDGYSSNGAGSAPAEPVDRPKRDWEPVVTPVEEAEGTARPPGIGQHRGNLAHLSANPRMRAWRIRIIIAAIVMVVFSLVFRSWQIGLTLAVIAVIADTIYRSRRDYPRTGTVRLTSAQRRTRRQLAKLGRTGYRAIHSNPIPDSEEQIDHLVVGPAGVFAIDSEDWDRRLAVRTRNARQLWHGPFSKKDRLEHAQWEAQRAADLLSAALGKPVTVRAAMAVYGPRIPWDVATIREVDVFSGPRLRKYLRRRARQRDVRPLSDDEAERIFKAASEAFPHFISGSPAR